MFFNKALNLYLDRFYSAFKPIVYNEIDSSKKTLISPSQETMDRLLPIIQQLQQSYPAELTVLQTEKIPFFCDVRDCSKRSSAGQ